MAERPSTPAEYVASLQEGHAVDPISREVMRNDLAGVLPDDTDFEGLLKEISGQDYAKFQFRTGGRFESGTRARR